MFSEIFLRGGSAAGHFPGVRPGDQMLAMKRGDLQRVFETLKDAGRDVSERLDLYNISEARMMQMLGRAKLIRDGFDTAELQKAFDKHELIRRLMA